MGLSLFTSNGQPQTMNYINTHYAQIKLTPLNLSYSYIGFNQMRNALEEAEFEDGYQPSQSLKDFLNMPDNEGLLTYRDVKSIQFDLEHLKPANEIDEIKNMLNVAFQKAIDLNQCVFWM